MRHPDARCVVCLLPGVTKGGLMLKNHSYTSQMLPHLYSYGPRNRGVAPRIFVCVHCLKDIQANGYFHVLSGRRR